MEPLCYGVRRKRERTVPGSQLAHDKALWRRLVHHSRRDGGAQKAGRSAAVGGMHARRGPHHGSRQPGLLQAVQVLREEADTYDETVLS